jgi:membrane dipeptidase
MHLTDSFLGATSSPLGRSRGRGGLTATGREMVDALNERRILVDLAHASRRTFFDALDALDACRPALPPLVSHTGVSGVHPSWRNLDDEQIRAVADRGGVVGIMYHRGFLGRPFWKVGAEVIVRHLEHTIAVGGEDVAALGSDWDGMIVTPRDMPTCLELPVLVDRMLARGWPEDRVRRVLGTNALRLIGTGGPQA